MKKKVLFSSYNLDIGGIETSLFNMLKSLDYNKYDVTLLLEKKEGIFLNEIPMEVKVIEYNTCNYKNIIIRKIKNRLKLIYYVLKYRNKFDFAGLYAPYLGPESTIVRYASKNNAIWVHSNYCELYKNDIEKIKNFFDKRKLEKFNKIIFVSNESKEDLCKIYSSIKNKSLVLSNIIDYKKIEELSKENIIEELKSPLITFVGRLDEESKRLTLLIESLSNIKQDYECIIIGDGPDRVLYENLIKEKKVSSKIKLLGKKENPYSYIKKSDVIVLTSYYEGFPVVLMEALVLNKPFISTVNASNKYIDLKDYGYIVNSKNFEEELVKIFNNKIKLKKSVDFNEYTKKIINDLEKVMEE